MANEIVTNPEHGEEIIVGGRASLGLQVFFDELVLRLNANLLGNAVVLPTFTVATLPTPSEVTRGMIFVSDESGGAVPAFSDGINWRRTTDRAIVS